MEGGGEQVWTGVRCSCSGAASASTAQCKRKMEVALLSNGPALLHPAAPASTGQDEAQ